MNLMKTDKKKKRKRGASRARDRTQQAPGLPDEVVIEILVRLPVRSLLRFKSVCKAWRATISDQFFVRAQLDRSSARQARHPSFLITPHTLDRVIPEEIWPTTFSNHFRFYRWMHGDSKASLVYDKDLAGEFTRVCYFAHCDGLVLAPTDTKLFLFNPATRDAVALPNDNRDVMQQQGGYYHSAAGLGLDPRTGKYKVVRSFYRTLDVCSNIYHMGMEVFTVGESGGGGAWREMERDPPYPVARWQTAVTVKGFMFWHMEKCHQERPPRGLLRLSLADEAFGVVDLPDSLDPAFDDSFMLDVLNGELWLTSRTSESPPPGTVNIWAMSPMEVGSSRWQRRYTIYVSDVCHPMGLLPGDGGLLLWKGYALYRCDLESSEVTTECEMNGGVRYQGRRARKWKNLFRFNVRPYTESLVRVTGSPALGKFFVLSLLGEIKEASSSHIKHSCFV